MSDFPPPPPSSDPAGPYHPQTGQSMPQYGQQPLDPQPPQYYAGPQYGMAPQTPTKRPGLVTAAGVITIVMSALSAVGGVILGVVLLAMDSSNLSAEDIADFEREMRDAGAENISVDDVLNIAGWIMLILGVISLVGILLGVLVLRRSNAARIVLTVFAGLIIVISLLALRAGFSALWLIAAILVIVFMYGRQANLWFKTR